MFFQHVYEEGLAQGSYVIGCQATGEAMVIDAKRDIDTYLQIAKKNNLKITHITETHIHADFLCGSRELADATGAKMYLSDEGGPDWQYEFPHEGVKDGDVIKMGNLSFEVWHTPGHTPESISFLLTDHAASEDPVMAFTGDFVFVGDVGRPDLLEKAAGVKGTMNEGAKQQYESVQRFSKLPDYIQVWPAHGAGSACGKALGAVPSSTIGYEKRANWAFRFAQNEQGFIDNLLDGQPEPPKYFAMMKKYNHEERPLLAELPRPEKLSKEAFLEKYHAGVKVIDTRGKEAFAEGFIPESINIPAMKAFSTWAGWFVDFFEPYVLIASEDQIEDLTRKLIRIGLDNIQGFITDVNEPGIPLQKEELVTLDEVKANLNNPQVQILDVRNSNEVKRGKIAGAQHAFVGTLEDHLDQIPQDKTLIVHCQSGLRASMAYSQLRRNGFDKVKTYFGGMQEWLGRGNEVVK